MLKEKTLGNFTPTTALIEAQKRLEQKRKRIPAKNAGIFYAPILTNGVTKLPALSATAEPNDRAHVVTKLPAHLGWESKAVSDQLRAKPAPAKTTTSAPIVISDDECRQASSEITRLQQTPLPEDTGPTVAMSPQMFIETRKVEGLTGSYRRYLHAKHLDKVGRGMVSLEALREYAGIAGRSKQFERDIRAGEGIFWRQDAQERIWLKSPSKTAHFFGIRRFKEAFVEFPLKYTHNMGEFKAWSFSAWLASHDTPLSCAVIEELTGIPERTQYKYRKEANVITTAQYAVGEAWDAVGDRQERAYEQGRGSFQFVDTHGKQGQAGASYIAWRMPNVYQSTLSKCSRNVKRRHNRGIPDLCMKRDEGNGESRSIVKLFHETGAVAGKVWNRCPERDAYHPAHVESKAGQFWHVLAKGGEF